MVKAMAAANRPTFSSLESVDDAVLVEIFCLAFPVSKLAFQAKLVSRRWKSLISSPIFVDRWKQTRAAKPQNALAVILNQRIRPGDEEYVLNRVLSIPACLFPLEAIDLDFLPCSNRGEPTSVRIAASCNGLLLCHSIGQFIDSQPRVYYICNPLTRQWVLLPPFPAKYPYMEDVTVGFVCHDGHGNCRVVRIHKGTMSKRDVANSFIAEVFSSETNTWEEREVWHPHGRDFSIPRPFMSGSDYLSHTMFSWNGILFLEDDSDDCIIAYDPFHPGRCRIIDTPRDRKGLWIDHMGFGEFEGSFRLLQHCCCDPYSDDEGDGFIRIWEMVDYEKGQWAFKNEIFFREIVTCDPLLSKQLYDDRGPWIQLLALDPNNEAIVYMYLFDEPDHEKKDTRGIFSCNFQTKEATLLDGTIIHMSAYDDKLCIRNVIQFPVPGWPTQVPELRANLHFLL